MSSGHWPMYGATGHSASIQYSGSVVLKGVGLKRLDTQVTDLYGAEVSEEKQAALGMGASARVPDRLTG